MKSIPERVRAATEDKLDPKELSDFVADLRENMHKNGTDATRTLGLFIVLFTAWLLVRSAVVQKISVMGAEIGRVDVLLILLPAMAAFFHYRYQCSMAMSDMIDTALRSLYSQRFPTLNKHELTELLAHPGFATVENAMANLESGFLARTASAWIIGIAILFTALPMIALTWCSWLLLSAPPMGLWTSIGCVVVILLLEFRTFLVFVQWMRQV